MSHPRLWHCYLIGISVAVLGLASSGPAQAQQGIGERLGQQLDEGLDRLGSELREGWASLRQTVDRMGVQGRVYSRLRWDKQIATAEIDIETQPEGVVVLRGTLSDEAAKQKAVQLAGDTGGVNRVVDELTVIEKRAAP